MNSHFCFMQSLWALRAVFLYAVKLKRTIFTLKLYFLESLCLGLVRRGIWVRKQLSPCISLCLRAEKSHVSKWESRHKLHGANTLIPSPLQKTLPNIVGWGFFSFSESIAVCTLHLSCKPQSPRNAYRQISCIFAFVPTKPVFSPASLHMFWI